jgi:hypothetical protein
MTVISQVHQLPLCVCVEPAALLENVGTGRLQGTAFNDRYGSVTQMTRLPVKYFPF